MDDLLAEFLVETKEGLAALDVALVRLERAPDDAATLGEIFRLVHTIKGTCGFLGLPRLEAVAHAGENVLGLYRDGTLPVTPDGVSAVLAALDRIRDILDGLERAGQEPSGDDSALIAALDAACEARPAPAASPAAVPPCPAAGPAAGPVPAAAPAACVPPSAPPALAAPAPPPAAPATPEGGPAEVPAAGDVAPQTIRVSVEVLEELMVLVSELVLTRNQLLQLARARDDAALASPLQRLSALTSDLQEGVMKTRMQPIGHAWNKLPRVVRDLSLELGKGLDLVMRGAETELDRQVLELIRDPLTHMVRNSADHGLEGPAERRAAGKPETGRIVLEACHEGGHIVIRLSDDGRGLDVARIRAKALARGLASEADLAQMGEGEIQSFIFRPGFSTAETVTAVSGRGVGMDVVKTNIERIGGAIALESREGRGTTFTIRIPLTLAIVSALIVEAGGERFAIPQIGVVELVRAGAGFLPIERIKDAPVIRLREHLLPLVSLPRLLRLGEGMAEEGFVVVTQVGAATFGILVDRVFDIEEIVVKPVAPILRHVTIFGGNTILGDGSVIMILDPNGIARAAGIGADGPREAEAADVGTALRSGRESGLLLFRAGGETPKAVPLELVARLERIPAERIEIAGGTPVVQYRGTLMPLVPLDPDWTRPAAGEGQMVLVFDDGEGSRRAVGLMVDAIQDVVQAQLRIEPGGRRTGFLGNAVIAGRATEVLDCAWWLNRGGGDWFAEGAERGRGEDRDEPARLLVVEDSAFFRNLVVPALAAAGHAVTAVAGGAEALRLREAGEGFDAIVSDIEMPGMDGIGFVRAVRAGGAWAGLPVIALTSRTEVEAERRGREAGFTDYVAKFDAATLLRSLRECLSARVAG